MEKHEDEGDLGPFLGQPVGVSFAVALDQTMRLQSCADRSGVDSGRSGQRRCRKAVRMASWICLAVHPPDRRAAVQQDFHEPDHAGVVDLDAGELRGSHRDGQRQPLQEREVDVNVQALRLEGGEAVGDRQELLAHGGEMIQALLQPEIGQIVGADLIAQEGGELLVLLHEGVFDSRRGRCDARARSAPAWC